MRMEKKEILKEDGRYLIYYHFPESATPEQAGTFAGIQPSVPEKTADGPAPPPPAPSPSSEDKPRV